MILRTVILVVMNNCGTSVSYLIVNDLGLVDYQKEYSSPKGKSIVLIINKGHGH